MVQGVLPKHAPDHPANKESVSAVAVRVTVVSESYSSLQSLPQEIPAGVLVIAPLPSPVIVTDNVNSAYVLTARTFPPFIFMLLVLSPVAKSTAQA